MELLAAIAWIIFGANVLLVLILLLVWVRDYGWKDRALAAEVERDALRSKLADVIDEAGRASATDGGWLARLLQQPAGWACPARTHTRHTEFAELLHPLRWTGRTPGRRTSSAR